MVGQNIGKYRVIDRVGRGGMGTVYRALDETLHREVAIKVLNAELNDPEVAKRFRAEAITVARLSHPGIATIYELFQHDGQWLMVMEFVRGETLEQLVARVGGLAPEQAATLCMQSLAALAHAHSMGVVHRDLKPANIMRTEGGDIKIMDFGIARVSGSEHLTSVGFMMGTPAYMAPEQVMGHEIDARADLYAIGVVFFRLLTGQLPFKGDTPFAMAQAQVNAPPTPIESLRQDLPGWVGEVLSRSLQKKPEERFQSATEFHETLQRAVSGATPPSSYQSQAPTGLVLTPPRAMPTGAIAETMLATPAAMPSGRVGPGGTGRTPATSIRDAADSTPTPVVTPKPGTEGGRVAPAPPPPRPVAAAASVAQPDVVADGGEARAGGRVLWLGAAVVVLLAVAGGAWWFLSSRDTAPVATADVAQVTPPLPESPAAATAPAAPVSAPATPPATPPAGRAAAPATTGGVPGAARSGSAGRSAAPASTSTPAAPAPAPAPVDAAPAVEIPNIKVLLVDGRRAVDQDATLNLGNGRIAAVSARDGSPLATWPYEAVTSATYVYARNPRWNAALAAPPRDLDVGGVFRASRHYITLQNATEFVILRAEDVNVIQIIRELESRTGLTIRRSAGEQD